MLARIQQDLFDFIEQDPEVIEGLVEFWYMANTDALSAAILKEEGYKIIINVSNFNHFEQLSKKLFLLADVIILRDTRNWTSDQLQEMSVPYPKDSYKPGYFDDVIDELKKLRPSPFTLKHRPEQFYWTSTECNLKNGYDMVYATSFSYNRIPLEFINWLVSSGKPYLQTGQIVYAPFMPNFEIEQELWNKHKVPLAEQFDAIPIFESNYKYFNEPNTESLMSIQFPYFHNIDIETLAKIKDDNHGEFENFSISCMNYIEQIKSKVGTPEFTKEIQYIKRNLIDDNLNKIDQKMKRISKMRSLRDSAILTYLMGLNTVSYLGLGDLKTLIAGTTGAVAAFVYEHVKRIRETGQIKENDAYFLWQLREEGKSR